ncbi:MAG: hypothetical protein QM754_00325 [Tepidisphaeraceae bacterium]
MLTGFEPFAHFSINPSWHAVSAAAERFGDRVAARLLPVDYHPARERLLAHVNELKPIAVLCTGLAAGDTFRLETIARKPTQFDSLPGEALHTGDWPWPLTEAALRSAGVAVRYSADAGRYVCESTYWTLLNDSRVTGPKGFLHVPAESAEYPIARTTAAVIAAIEAFLDKQ